MNTERFFFNIDTSFRLMKARDAFFEVLLKTGIITAAVSAVMAFFAVPSIQAVTAVCVIISTGIAAFFAGRIYFKPRAYEAPLYYDRAVDGGERFPALRELIEEKKQGWVRDVLEQECGEIIAKKIRGVFPFFRGRGKYFFLPYIIVFVILALPAVKSGRDTLDQSGGSPLITEKITSGNDTYVNEQIPPDQTPEAEQNPKKWEMTDREINEMKELLDDEKFRKLLKELIENGYVSGNTKAKIPIGILKGNNTEMVQRFLSQIDELIGGGSTGPGASLINGVREALDKNDFARAAVEFKLFLKFLETRAAKTIILKMKGRVEEYKQRSVINSNADYIARNGSTDIMPFPHTRYANIPFQYRGTVTRYFELNR